MTDKMAAHHSVRAGAAGGPYDAVAATALWTAAARARESRRADRLFADPLAETLAGPDGAALLRHFHTSHAPDGGNPFLPIRTRWFDDFLQAAARPRQVVGLGAGLDTRAYRLNWPAGTVLFEIDQPSLLDYKLQRLASAGAGAPRCDCRRVPADLAGTWVTALARAGFDRSAPTSWFAEGVLFYLPRDLAGAVVRCAADLSAPGSVLAADLIGTGIFRFPYLRPFLDRLREAGSPWQFGTDDPGGFMESCGWHPLTVTEPGQASAAYGRWPAQSEAVMLPGLPRSFLVSAALGE